MGRLFAGVICLLALCGCNSAPENPVDAAVVSAPTLTATPPPRVAHEGPASGPDSFLLRQDLQRRSKSTPTVA